MRVVVVGGGTGGATFAGTLARAGVHDVVLLEAGTDFGPFAGHQWPFELLDSRRLPTTFDWGLENADPGTDRRYAVARAKVMGGCSSHNGCAAVRGLRSDFDQWASIAGPFWDADAFQQDFASVEQALRVRGQTFEEITPFQRDVYAAARARSIPASIDINDIDEGVGVSVCPVNKQGGIRWNAAFAFVDPVRERSNFSIIDRYLATGLLVDGGRVAGVMGVREGSPLNIAADLVVLAAGAYGSPELLMRAGIGDASLLTQAGLPVHHHLPGVGRNLQDHPCAVLEYRAGDGLIARMVAFEQEHLAHDEAVIVKARSPLATTNVDVHIFSSGGRRQDAPGWYWQLWVGLLTPRARGRIQPYRAQDGVRFAIEHMQLTDPAATDLACLRWGVGLAREIAAAAPLSDALADELAPGTPVASDDLDAWIQATHLNYFHPAGTCAMGRSPADGAVVDEMCRVHGVPGLMVADASVMPVITAANTNIPTAALAYRLARHFDSLQPRNG